MVTRENVVEAIQKVFDPEIPVNVYDLGLIYEIEVKDQAVQIKMSLTSQGCPSAREIPDMVRSRVLELPGVADVDVQVVWNPPWNPSMISQEGKKILKLEDES